MALALNGCARAAVERLPLRDAANATESGASVTPALPEVRLDAADRILILSPHPDDEVLGCGGIIQQAVTMKLPIRVVFLTYGDNNEWSFLVYRKHPVLFPGAVRAMGQVRHDEALAAAKALGLLPDQLTFLGYPDFGTLAIWYAHWGAQPPYTAMLTQARAVPYASALRPGAPYKGEEILRDLTTVLRAFRPTKIFISHPADHNGDHSALYLFTRVALWDLHAEMSPKLYPYLIHLAHWPKPRGRRPKDSLQPPAVLGAQLAWVNHRLSPQEMDRKQRALQAHRSQYSYSADYLLSFVRANELFGDFPDVPLYHGLTLHAEKTPGATPEPPEELTAEERAAYSAIDLNFIRLEGQELIVSIQISHALHETAEATIYAFGYRHDRPFVEMPKVRATVGEHAGHAFDLNRPLAHDEVALAHQPTVVTMRLPLKTLGNPDRVLLSARTHRGEVPLDWVAWRVLEVTPQQPHVMNVPTTIVDSRTPRRQEKTETERTGVGGGGG